MAKSTAKTKGKVLEDLVAALHRLPSMQVGVRVRLPSVKPYSRRKREVDVLLTTNVAGYPVRIAFSCKNERKKVRTGQISEFIADLGDVGIPLSYGVVVTSTGFTSDALRMAEEHGIRPLVFDGLDSTRLAVEVSQALRSVVYFACEWRDIQYFDNAITPPDQSAPTWCTIVSDAHVPFPQGNLRDLAPYVLNRVWELWSSDCVPMTLGKHTMFLSLTSTAPATAAGQRGIAFVEVRVVAFVARLVGTLTDTRLRHAKTQTVEKRLLSAEFPEPPGAVQLSEIAAEADLQAYLSGTHALTVVHRIRVPRLLSGGMYWPPTLQALHKVEELLKAKKPITLAEVEGANLAQAWAFVVRPQQQASPAEQSPP